MAEGGGDCLNIGYGTGRCGTTHGHPIKDHVVDGVNPNILHCQYKWIEKGPHGEYIRWVTCGATCYPTFPTLLSGTDGPRMVDAPAEPSIIFRSTGDKYRVYKMFVSINTDAGQPNDVFSYTLTYIRPDGEEYNLTVDTTSPKQKERIDVLAPLTFVRTQAKGIFKGKYQVEANIKKLNEIGNWV